MSEKTIKSIISYCESCLEKYGDTPAGVDWMTEEKVDIRYQVMLDIIKENDEKKVSLLDFGCGASHLYEYIKRRGMSDWIVYSGLDISEKYIELSKSKFPDLTFYCQDINDDDSSIDLYDYIIMNGVFTRKCDLPFEEMFAYFSKTIVKAFNKVKIGLAFNVMSKQVNWEDEELFYVPFDRMSQFLATEISRHFVFRHDYGLYEYTVYVYNSPN